MAASFPTSVKTWTDVVDNVDDIVASHINGAYAEIIAVETSLTSMLTTITTNSASTTPTQTLATNNEYRFTNAAITTIGITIPANLPADFISSVVWRNPASTAALTITNSSGLTAKYSGDGVVANAFTPAVSKTYDMVFYNNGVNINIVIRGV